MYTLLMVLAAAPAPVKPDGAVTVKFYEEKAGDVRAVSKKEDNKGTIKIEVGGMKNEVPNNSKKTLKYTETIVDKAKGADQPTKLVRKYETAESVAMGMKKKLPYDGLEVTITKVKDKYEFTADGKEMAADDAEDLDREFNKKAEKVSNKDFLPPKAVKVGDSWDLPMKKLAEGLGSGDKIVFDADKSTGTAKLTKVMDKDGAAWGAIDIKLTLAVKSLDFGNGDTPAADGSTMTLAVTMEVCIDGTQPGETSKGTLDISITADVGNNATVTIASKGTIEETDVATKKK